MSHFTRLKVQSLDLEPTSVDHFQQVFWGIDDDINRIIGNLRPAALLDRGLASAVRAYVDEWSLQSGLSCDLDVNARQSLPVLVESTIYRIVQEALTNVARHARAQRASVLIVEKDNCLTAIVKDDGVGFDSTDRAPTSERLGLIGMRERAALLGGRALSSPARAPAHASSSVYLSRDLKKPVSSSTTSVLARAN